ncbi:phage terminase large subunit family protein [Herbaspirillum huttiense]|uniref:phage terminase large subunit family protein n=1 Tax=Herbaspirillum huttiense TaxID=863372 RepID=UPI00288969EE|nr:terminase gpA endonuclease subunit [Herbaspirillum huttiense]
MSTSTLQTLGSPTQTSGPKADRLRRSFRQGWTPPPRISVPEWADRYRQLAPEAGSTSGAWRTDTVEIARGPMLAVTEPGVHIITAMVSTQLLKTALLENVFGFFAHLDPCPMLLLQPKEQAAEQFAKERIAPYIRVTPVLRALVGTSKTRNKDETLLYKAFPGGFLALAGAGSPDNLARRPIRVLLSDEVDKYPVTREGDPIALAEERTATFGVNWLSIRACSPTIEDESRIEASYKDSDMRRASLECPHCGHRMFPDFFKHVHWDKRLDDAGNVVEHLPKTARIYCECCGVQWSEGDRLKALKTARWHQTRPFDCCGARHVPLMAYDQRWNEKDEGSVEAIWDWWTSDRHAVYRAKCPDCGSTPVDNSHAGFQASKLYSPWQKDKPADIAGKWLTAKGDPDREQAWWNTQMGLPHRPHSGKELQLEALVARGEIWPAAVPDGVGVVTAGVDVQDYRVEIETVGWGRNEESWSIDTHVIDGEFSDPKVQEQLDAYLAQIWRRVDRRGFEVMAACIDSGGHHTEAVYQFCKARLGRRIWAVKGESARNGARNPVWPTKRPSSRNKSTFRPVILGVNAAKDTIRNRLHLENVGPGYMHFPHDRDIGYFAQLTSERSVVKVQSGQKFRVWELPNGKANEALDMRVYAYAALCGLMHIGLKLNKRVDALLAPPPTDEAASMPTEVPAAAAASVVQVAQSTRKSLAARLA